ncbi:MAG: hypothetical protein NT150_00525 [Bacteroidetes bacterium]|nr:hypothetical protein [Bacteroidota bacterium]
MEFRRRSEISEIGFESKTYFELKMAVVSNLAVIAVLRDILSL